MANKELELAWKIITNTDTNLFLTGKAGTGKTTFLRELRKKSVKQMIVVAPTGIAAINAQGVTIHSFFQLPFGPQVPGAQYNSQKRYSFKRQKLRLIRSIDLIVIDEISMVRADLLDAIDRVLRQYRDRGKPFGGVQMLLIGDMQQLSPVAREEEWRMLSPYYETPYFFSSIALQQSDFVTVELQHVYRQSDPYFIELLNKVRTNTADENTLAALNKRHIPGFVPDKSEGYIRLVTHNAQADTINSHELEALQSPLYEYKAKVQGDFPEMSYPTESNLCLKLGAQVMFIKNDSSPQKRYYNGMIGEIVDIDNEHIKVKPSNDEAVIDVSHETWENIKYELDETTREVTESIAGTFSQYPVKTAWAITVHKSQGLTFERAIIDVQHSFAHGQTYVALSRCKSLEGMVLANPIPRHAIISDSMVEKFSEDQSHQNIDDERLDTMERKYMLRTIEELFNFSQLSMGFNDMIRIMREHFYDTYPMQYKSWCDASESFKENVVNVALRFKNQYQNIIFSEDDFHASPLLQERLKKASEYFEGKLVECNTLLQRTSLPTDNQTVADRIETIGLNMSDSLKFKMQLLHHIYADGFRLQEYLRYKTKLSLDEDSSSDVSSAKPHKETTSKAGKKKFTGSSASAPEEITNSKLYNALVEWRRKKASEEHKPAYVILSQNALMGLASRTPATIAQLKKISGIGAKTAQLYGDELLAMVRENS